MTANELLEMVNALEIPDVVILTSGSVFSGLEALCLTCVCFRTAGDLHELSMKHCHAQSAISEIVNWTVTFIDNMWSHLLDFDYAHLLTPTNLQKYANVIHDVVHL
jgi:hypothetical protein